MKIEKAKLEEIKGANPVGIFEGEISFTDAEGAAHNVTFVYRKPTTADLEMHGKLANKNPVVANLNLIQSLIVHPDPGPIIEEMREYPAAYGRFVDEAISPFYGANVAVKSRKL